MSTLTAGGPGLYNDTAMKIIKHILTALALTILVFSASVVFTLNFKPLYYADMERYRLSERFGYPEEEIRANYDAMVEYNNFFYKGELEFPTVPMSENAREHFREVRVIFVFIETVLLPIGIIGSIAGILLCRKERKQHYLLLSGIFSIGIPSALGGLIAANWETFFTKFHELFFNNDYWIFNSATDPIIDLLPDEFFLHCCIMILGIILAFAAVCIILYIKRQRSKA